MPVSRAFQPRSAFAQMGPDFADPVEAADFPQTILRFRHQRVATRLGLDSLTDEEWLSHFGRFQTLPGAQPRALALRYHGHQFRSYNPDLGDGRGFLFAQMEEHSGRGARLADLSTKGSGRTPYSRSGDGRLTLKGGVREVLATAMLEALGVPTSDSLSLIETGEPLHRNDEPSPTRGAVLVRRTHASIRFGTFQRHAFHDRPDLVARLVDHVVATYHPHLESSPVPAAALLREVVRRTADLAAAWMAAGFVHGVLNTDNMNINGESFDYGPYRFLPRNDPNFTAAYFDQNGLYAFGRQPEAVYWNLRQLAGCLLLVADEAALGDALGHFATDYREALSRRMLARLGVRSVGPAEDVELVNAAFKALAAGGVDLRWEPFFFDWFGGAASVQRALSGPRAALYQTEPFTAFRALLESRRTDRPERLSHPLFQRVEPVELLYDQIEALWARIAVDDDWRGMDAKLAEIEQARLGYGLS